MCIPRSLRSRQKIFVPGLIPKNYPDAIFFQLTASYTAGHRGIVALGVEERGPGESRPTLIMAATSAARWSKRRTVIRPQPGKASSVKGVDITLRGLK